MSDASNDPRTLAAAQWFVRDGWTVNVDHDKGTVVATMPSGYGEGPAEVNVISLVYAIIEARR